MDYLGYVNDWDTILFDDPDRIISYPLSYGDSYDDDFHATVFGIDAQVEQGHRNHVADGTGDLILPFGTVSNVLRVHSTSTTISVVGTDTTTFYDEWFTFYKPGVHFEILSSSFDGQWAGWLDEYSIGLQESLIHPIGIDVFPNPAQCQVDLVYSFTDGRMSCQVLDATGRTVFEQLLEGKAGIARASVTITGWASGMYTVRITDEHGASGIARLVVR